jgi:hypothetical protein
MKKFSARFRADWNNDEILGEILEEYFSDDEIIKTKASLCYWLNISEREFEVRRRTDMFKELLDNADLYVRCLIEQSGMLNDRTFSRFLLETQYGYAKPVAQEEEKAGQYVFNFVDA